MRALQGVDLYGWEDFVEHGKERPAEACPPHPDDLACIMYTSGTTGACSNRLQAGPRLHLSWTRHRNNSLEVELQLQHVLARPLMWVSLQQRSSLHSFTHQAARKA